MVSFFHIFTESETLSHCVLSVSGGGVLCAWVWGSGASRRGSWGPGCVALVGSEASFIFKIKIIKNILRARGFADSGRLSFSRALYRTPLRGP